MSDISNAIIDDGLKYLGRSQQQIKPNPQLFTSLFPKKTVIEREIIQLDSRVIQNKTVSYVNPDGNPKDSSKDGFTTDIFKLPTIQDMKNITRQDLLMRGFGESPYASNISNQEKISEMINGLLRDQINLFNTKVEIGAIDAYFNGKLSIIGEGENRELLFNRAGSLVPVLTQ